MTKSQHALLRMLSLHPGGAVIRTSGGIEDLKALCLMGCVQDCYELSGGEFVGSISPAGREAVNAPLD